MGRMPIERVPMTKLGARWLSSPTPTLVAPSHPRYAQSRESRHLPSPAIVLRALPLPGVSRDLDRQSRIEHGIDDSVGRRRMADDRADGVAPADRAGGGEHDDPGHADRKSTSQNSSH